MGTGFGWLGYCEPATYTIFIHFSFLWILFQAISQRKTKKPSSQQLWWGAATLRVYDAP